MKIATITALSLILSSCGPEITSASVEKDFEKPVVETKAPSAELKESQPDIPEQDEAASDYIEVNVSDLKNLTGQICYTISKDTKKFPPEKDDAIDSQCVDIEGDENSFRIYDLEMGVDHAIAVFHDENFNGELDTKKLFGLDVPKEGFGFSRNPGIKVTGYKFKDCSFKTEAGLIVNIGFQYISF